MEATTKATVQPTTDRFGTPIWVVSWGARGDPQTVICLSEVEAVLAASERANYFSIIKGVEPLVEFAI